MNRKNVNRYRCIHGTCGILTGALNIWALAVIGSRPRDIAQGKGFRLLCRVYTAASKLKKAASVTETATNPFSACQPKIWHKEGVKDASHQRLVLDTFFVPDKLRASRKRIYSFPTYAPNIAWVYSNQIRPNTHEFDLIFQIFKPLGR